MVWLRAPWGGRRELEGVWGARVWGSERGARYKGPSGRPRLRSLRRPPRLFSRLPAPARVRAVAVGGPGESTPLPRLLSVGNQDPERSDSPLDSTVPRSRRAAPRPLAAPGAEGSPASRFLSPVAPGTLRPAIGRSSLSGQRVCGEERGGALEGVLAVQEREFPFHLVTRCSTGSGLPTHSRGPFPCVLPTWGRALQSAAQSAHEDE